MALTTRRERSKTRRKYRIHKAVWVDPFPGIPGTEPEKRIFAALVSMHVYFVFHGGSPEESKKYAIGEPDHDIDFFLPEYRIIIDPFSPYFHSQKDSVSRDIRKAAIFSAAGVPTYHPWAVGLKPGTSEYLFSWDQAALNPNADENKQHPLLRGAAAYDSFAHGAQLKGQAMGARELLGNIPEIMAGPRYKLTNPQWVTDKAHPGYTLGTHLGTGANSVGLANKARARFKNPKIQVGARSTRRRP